LKAVVQRVSRASVTVDAELAGAIGPGLVVLLGIHQQDTFEDVEKLCGKIVRLRVFEDPAGQMNLSLLETGGDLLVISQFTLIARTRKGNRPSFNDAARPEQAIPLYEAALGRFEVWMGKAPASGRFGAEMQVSLVNDGPVTIILDTREGE
jgi:D-aminoacyl-tRNA deacylase